MSSNGNFVRVLGDRLLVKPIKEEQKTAAGLILPDTGEEENNAKLGVVVSVAERVKNPELEEDAITVNETVLFSRFAGTQVVYKGDEYRILRVSDVLGIKTE